MYSPALSCERPAASMPGCQLPTMLYAQPLSCLAKVRFDTLCRQQLSQRTCCVGAHIETSCWNGNVGYHLRVWAELDDSTVLQEKNPYDVAAHSGALDNWGLP